ncbi:MAG: hypothetical protein ABI844_06215 [Saprospiraceae bacterium]
MTLQDFFNFIGSHPSILLFYGIAIPLSAFLTGVFSRDEGYLSPWKYLYSFIIYLVCVPGIFALMLNIYLFLFERQSIWSLNLYTQALPVVVMIFTLMIIRKFVNLDYIPGFEKLGGLVLMVTAVLLIMWFLDKTHIYVFSFMPFSQVILIIIGLLVAIRFAWKKLAG